MIGRTLSPARSPAHFVPYRLLICLQTRGPRIQRKGGTGPSMLRFRCRALAQPVHKIMAITVVTTSMMECFCNQLCAKKNRAVTTKQTYDIHLCQSIDPSSICGPTVGRHRSRSQQAMRLPATASLHTFLMASGWNWGVGNGSGWENGLAWA